MNAIVQAIECAPRAAAPDPLLHESAPAIEPFDLSTATVGDFLDNRPPPRVWVVDDVLPLGCVALLAAAGGTGKSVAVMQLAVSVCTGLGWLGMAIERTGSVLIVSAEDDRPEAHRRLHRIADHYKAMVESTRDDWMVYDELLKERLHFLDRVGKDNRLTAKVDRELIRTGFADRVIATAKELPGLVLIVLDPLSRFDGGDGNDNSDGTRLIECAEHIRKATGATVMLPHHVSKAGLKDPQSGQEAVRGASGLVDGARWVGMLATLRKEHAEEYGIAPEDAGKFVQFTIPKSNYAPPFAGFWMRRCDGGVLERTLMKQVDVRSEKRARQGEDRYAELLPKLVELIQRKQIDGAPLTHRAMREFSGSGGIFGVGDKTLRSILARAIEEGAVKEHVPEGKRHAELHTW